MAEPSFREVAEALLEQVRYDALTNELAEPFMAGLPEKAPGLEHTFRGLQRRMQLIAYAREIFAEMAPREAEHRLLIEDPAARIVVKETDIDSCSI